MPDAHPHHRGDGEKGARKGPQAPTHWRGEKGARKGPRPSHHLPRLYYDYEGYGYEAVVLARFGTLGHR